MRPFAGAMTVVFIFCFGSGQFDATEWTMEARFACACLAAFCYWAVDICDRHDQKS